MDQHRHAPAVSPSRTGGEPPRRITNEGELAAALLHAAVEHAIADNKQLGHESLAAVILPQVAEQDRDHLEIGLYAAFKAGLFENVPAETFQELPKELLSAAVAAGRELFAVMEKVQESRNPMQMDFRYEKAKAIVAWLKLVERRVPARNRLVVYADLGDTFSHPRTTQTRPAASLGRQETPRHQSQSRPGNLTDAEVARRAAALKAAQASCPK
ncbi:MAG TPA: hypothetical protein V6C81_11810 [Planktothrix sp.]|jgi:hypothetical protein